MRKIETDFFEIGMMDHLSAQDSPVHRFDPRVKLFITLVFTIAVTSFGKYEISALLPFVIYPVFLTEAGRLPAGYIMRKILLVSPLAVLIGMFNPVMDKVPLVVLGACSVSGGWLSFISLIIRFVLTVWAALALLSVTGIYNVCAALEKLGVPKVFIVQLLFLYRYIFVLVSEGERMVRARAVRSFGVNGMGAGAYGAMLGSLLLRALDRAQRVHLAMSCRGFDGHVRTVKPLKIRGMDILFLIIWLSFFILARTVNLSMVMGRFVTEVLL